jgi:hypothetical protein
MYLFLCPEVVFAQRLPVDRTLRNIIIIRMYGIIVTKCHLISGSSGVTKASCRSLFTSTNPDVHVWDPDEAGEVLRFFTDAGSNASRH